MRGPPVLAVLMPEASPSSDVTPGAVALPAPPYAVAGEEVLEGAPVRVHFADGSRRSGHLLAFDPVLGTFRLETDGRSATYGIGEILDLVVTTPVDPADAAAQQQSVPFEVRLHDGRSIRGDSLGAIRRPSDLTLFVRRNGHFHRLVLPAAAIATERIGPPLGEVLVKDQGVDAKQVETALADQDGEARSSFRQTRKRLGERLRDEGNLTDEGLARALAAKLGLPYVGPDELTAEKEALDRIPAEVAHEAVALPLSTHGNHLRIALADPTDADTLKRLEFVSGMQLDIVVAPADALRSRLGSIASRVQQSQAMRDLGLAEEGAAQDNEQARARDRAATEKLAGQKPIVRLVAQLIRDALNRRASDIHIRPDGERINLLYRIDGMLVPVQDISRLLLPALIGRIKILGQMDIAERRVPQDGRTEVVVGDRQIDIRISVMPTVNGESAVLRLLDSEAGVRAVDQLGLSPGDTQAFRDLINRRHGLFLVTGPTGSGKSTTLYAALGEVRKGPVNIVTVEDPVEYHMPGVQQVQVLRAAGLTFARALRNILRHDPDVIMIGEIRDEETAQIATESALTGHLVFSTLHTNSAAGSITRLLEMGIQSYLLQPTLLGIMAQRLLRRNCVHCRAEERVSEHVRRTLELAPDERFQRGRGCDRCNQTGYSGRLVAYELMRMTERLRAAIEADVDEAALVRIARMDGMVPLGDHALALARSGETSLEEAYRLHID